MDNGVVCVPWADGAQKRKYHERRRLNKALHKGLNRHFIEKGRNMKSRNF